MKRNLETELNDVFKVCVCGRHMELIPMSHSIIGSHIVKNFPYLKCTCGEIRELSYLRFILLKRIKGFSKRIIDFNYLLKTS